MTAMTSTNTIPRHVARAEIRARQAEAGSVRGQLTTTDQEAGYSRYMPSALTTAVKDSGIPMSWSTGDTTQFVRGE